MAAHNLVIAYDLIRPGQNYDAVRGKIKSLGRWYQLQYSLFYVHTSLTPHQAHAQVISVMDANDKLAIVDSWGAVITPLPKDDINAINAAWFSDQQQALPYAATANG